MGERSAAATGTDPGPPPPAVGATRDILADGALVLDRSPDGRATLTLDRPHRRHALTLPLLEAIAGVADHLAGTGCRVLVLQASGEQAFCSGFEIGALDTAQTAGPDPLGADGFYALDRRLSGSLARLEAAPYPVIVKLRGWCIGGGLELACAADIRIAAAGVRFRMPPAKLGWVYSLKGLSRLTQAIGIARARHLLLSAEVVSDTTALAWGLVTDLVAPDALDARVDAMAADIATSAPLALAGLKQALATLAAPTLDPAAWALHLDWRRRAIASTDLVEGKAALLDHRPPHFTGS